jgi:hypothetical protein
MHAAAGHKQPCLGGGELLVHYGMTLGDVHHNQVVQHALWEHVADGLPRLALRLVVRRDVDNALLALMLLNLKPSCTCASTHNAKCMKLLSSRVVTK